MIPVNVEHCENRVQKTAGGPEIINYTAHWYLSVRALCDQNSFATVLMEGAVVTVCYEDMLQGVYIYIFI